MSVDDTREAAWREMQARNARTRANEPGGTIRGLGGTSNDMDRGQVADMIAASEARVDTRMTEMNGKLDRLLDKITIMDAKVSEGKADNQRTRSTVRTTAIALGGSLLTGLALTVAVANVSFGFGSRVAETARLEAAQVYNQAEARRIRQQPAIKQKPERKLLPPAKT